MERVKLKVLRVKLMLHKWLPELKTKKLKIKKLRISKKLEELLELMEKLNYLRKNLTNLLLNKRN